MPEWPVGVVVVVVFRLLAEFRIPNWSTHSQFAIVAFVEIVYCCTVVVVVVSIGFK